MLFRTLPVKGGGENKLKLRFCGRRSPEGHNMKNLTAEQLIALATSTAIELAKNTKKEEIGILADFFNLIGAVLITIYDKESLDSSLSKDNQSN